MQVFKDMRGAMHPIAKIERIYPRRRYVGEEEWQNPKVFLSDGDEHGLEIDEGEFERLQKKMSRVLPALPGFTLLSFVFDDEGDDWIDEADIIGWREDEHGEFDPIVVDESDKGMSGVETAILEPSGKVRIPYLAEFESREAWEKEVRRNSDAKRAKLKSKEV